MASTPQEDVKKQANLRLLQRSVSPDISDILQTATHVVLYEYKSVDGAPKTWHKSGVEGSLFLTTAAGGVYQLVILNRACPDNFCCMLHADTQLQHQDPYLIVSPPKSAPPGSDTAIRGIWFPVAEERLEMTKSVQDIVKQLQQAPAVDSSAALAAMLGVTSMTGQAQAAVASTTPPPASSYAQAAAASTSTPAASTNTPATPSTPSVMTPLDKKSLQLALLSLLQDDRFLDLIHSQYLRVVQAQQKKKSQSNNTPK